MDKRLMKMRESWYNAALSDLTPSDTEGLHLYCEKKLQALNRAEVELQAVLDTLSRRLKAWVNDGGSREATYYKEMLETYTRYYNAQRYYAEVLYLNTR